MHNSRHSIELDHSNQNGLIGSELSKRLRWLITIINLCQKLFKKPNPQKTLQTTNQNQLEPEQTLYATNRGGNMIL